MAKNKDSKTVNRTGTFDMDKMQIVAESKDGFQTYDLKALLQEFDGEQLSFTLASDFNPSHLVKE
ncbi:YonK family protein [Paenibacillus barcinonensis]|uniref:YonK family protein n=1 Tax=Paenibacillus barcinonensis TaxID=198119 RepID=A0A2V4VWE1_PAEBA|nr:MULTISPECIES: YonK family protein [Paenibacillus]PYE51626.1 YonK protein [Paenibacillus barcinonensis]QKS55990.1 YonK family protein [Paenibacillus barcinonensis]